MEKRLLCGAARAEITPQNKYYSKLYGLFGMVYTGVIDPLYLRVIALDDGEKKALIIGFDLDKAPNPAQWLPKLEEQFGIPAENILYMGTHTHSAPVTTVRPREKLKSNITEEMQAAMREYEAEVLEILLDTAQKALSEMRPARIGYAYGNSYINVNRIGEFAYEDEIGQLYPFSTQADNEELPVDRTVFVAKIEDEAGVPIAFFVNYAVHCAVMFLNRFDDQGNSGISGDIAGTVSRHIENKYPGSVAIWSSGAAGDVNPLVGGGLFYPDPKNGDAAMFLCANLKDVTERMQYMAAKHFADVLRTIRSIKVTTSAMRIAGAIEWSETPSVDEAAGPYRIRLHVLRLGELAFYGIGGELFTSFGKLIRDTSPMKNTVVVTHEASLIEDAGYVVDDATMARAARKAPAHGFVPGGNAPNKPGYVADSLIEHTRSLFEKVL